MSPSALEADSRSTVMRGRSIVFTRRPADWKLVMAAMAVVAAAVLLMRPAAVGLVMITFIMAGLPALYRMRRHGRASRTAASSPDRTGRRSARSGSR
jgi:hypothetical protein